MKYAIEQLLKRYGKKYTDKNIYIIYLYFIFLIYNKNKLPVDI